ncbi:hypothetical protein IV203_022244 [Nitzschia inconspicua]|uniref:Uncharacterized protein n=1 Tax=Nitzschia inconspicua TaxID=303405 RepID=A0A9K3KJ85_9STRA|nr:hypothetical protein IV203_022244 [Nitzschia inconspicua]
MRHYLHAIVLNWEQSGNGGQQRSDDAEDWGTVDPLLVVDGDDRKIFLPSGEANMYYLLYYWHKLEKEGYLQFTLAKLAEGIRASAEEIALVREKKRLKPSNEKAEALASSIKSLADTMSGLEDRKAHEAALVLATDRMRLRCEMLEKLVQAEEKMEAINDPSSSLYKALKQAKQGYQKMLDSLEE